MPLFFCSAVKSAPTFLIASASDRSFRTDACVPFAAEPPLESEDPCSAFVTFDTTALEAEHDELLQETQVVSDLVQQCIYENAHVALDQAEYQKRYDALTQRFDKAKARLEEVTEEISQKQTQRANYEAFLKAFERLPDQLPEFTLKTWHGLVDYVTVYAEDDIRFTFKNGQEVKA